MKLFRCAMLFAILIFSATFFLTESALAAPEQTGVFQEQVQEVNSDKRTIFTYSEKTVRIFPTNPTVGKTKIMTLGKGEEIPLSKLKSGQWIAVKGHRFYDYANHAMTIDARVIYILQEKISTEELKKLE